MNTPVNDRHQPVPSNTDAELSSLALAAAQAGAHAILRVLRTGDLQVETKLHSADFVTTADKAAEAAILRIVRAVRPRDAVLAEESGVHAGDSGIRWLVDPLDGTMNFVHRRRDYAVSVGVEREGRMVAGAIVRPADGEWAAAGGAEVLGRDLTPKVSDTADLSDALVGIGLPSPLDQRIRVHEFVGSSSSTPVTTAAADRRRVSYCRSPWAHRRVTSASASICGTSPPGSPWSKAPAAAASGSRRRVVSRRWLPAPHR